MSRLVNIYIATFTSTAILSRKIHDLQKKANKSREFLTFRAIRGTFSLSRMQIRRLQRNLAR